ncbi:SRPBCC domain-containing protein [Paenibacillus yanchengensis]|uniref:SRPBCC domain-containing protein n=1 Tax=Paenibacillus yanchengensis TaxID=2035833 RepID=A0ABW4YHK0_9BACL
MMELAHISRVDQENDTFSYTAALSKPYVHSLEQVFQMFVDNEKLCLWFPELSIDHLETGGIIRFDMGNDLNEEMTILEYSHHEVIAFTWDQDQVSFQVESSSPTTCQLKWVEYIKSWTEHTPRDVAGWHTCLDVIALLLDGEMSKDDINVWRKERWKQLYDKYSAMAI